VAPIAFRTSVRGFDGERITAFGPNLAERAGIRCHTANASTTNFASRTCRLDTPGGTHAVPVRHSSPIGTSGDAAMRKLSLLLAAVALVGMLMPVAPLVASAADKTTTTITFSPNLARYKRGAEIRLIATVRYPNLGNTRAIPPGNVMFYKYSTMTNHVWQKLGTAPIDNSGQAHLRFVVPTNPNDDWVYVIGKYSDPTGTDARLESPQVRIPIG
jgi:hypothetical protein